MSQMISDPSNHLDVRMVRLEGSYEQPDKRLDAIDRRLDRFEGSVEARLNKLDAKIDARSSVLPWLSGGFGLVIVALQVFGAVGII